MLAAPLIPYYLPGFPAVNQRTCTVLCCSDWAHTHTHRVVNSQTPSCFVDQYLVHSFNDVLPRPYGVDDASARTADVADRVTAANDPAAPGDAAAAAATDAAIASENLDPSNVVPARACMVYSPQLNF